MFVPRRCDRPRWVRPPQSTSCPPGHGITIHPGHFISTPYGLIPCNPDGTLPGGFPNAPPARIVYVPYPAPPSSIPICPAPPEPAPADETIVPT
jgi:hypothetical protein